MVAETIDYRVSRIAVLCKDCNSDVGLYPARHKCGVSAVETVQSPPIPEIPKKFKAAALLVSSQKANSNSNINNKTSEEASSGGEGGLWGKLRSVRNWKDVTAEGTHNKCHCI